ncbi:hypothetical protein [Halostagnicola bangensis]
MVNSCLNCGKPLGSRTTLCHDCESADEKPTPPEGIDDSVVDRLERYFIIASTRCSSCGDIHGTVPVDGDTYTAADFEIDSRAEWSDRLDEEEAWMRENRTTVEAALVELEDDWPHSVAALRSHVL